MNKTMTAMVLVLAAMASQASAQTFSIASVAAPAPVAQMTVAMAVVQPALDRDEVSPARAARAAVRPAAHRAATRPAALGGSESGTGLQALQWIYAAVTTCHDASNCPASRNGIALNFSMPY